MKPTDDGGQLLSEWKCSFYGDTARGAAETAVILDKRLVDVERKIHVLGDALGVQQPAPSRPRVPGSASGVLEIVEDDALNVQQPAHPLVMEIDLDKVAAQRAARREEDERLRARAEQLEEENARLKSSWELVQRKTVDQEREIEKLRMQLAACGVLAGSNTADSLDFQIRNMHPDYDSESAQSVIRAVNREISLRAEVETLQRRVRELQGQQANSVAVMQYYRDLPTISQLQAENAGLKEENASLMAKAEAMSLELESHRARLTGNDALRTEIEELKEKRGDLREALRNVLSQIEDVRVEAQGALID